MVFAATGIILIVAGICGLVALLLYHFRRLHLYLGAAKFPGPMAFPIIGNAHNFVGSTGDILNKVEKLLCEYPSPFRVWLGNRLFFGVNDAEQLKIILHSPKSIEKEDLYKYMRPWLGTGLLTAPASKWRIHRKLISPTFNTSILKSFVEVFAKQGEIMTTQMEKELQGGEFDIFEYVSRCTLDIICETAMGVTIKAQTETNCRYVTSAQRMLEIIYKRMFKIWLHSDFIFNLTKLASDQRECLKYLHGKTNDVIQKKKMGYNASFSGVENEDPANRSTMRKAFLDLLMELSNGGTKLTDEELRDEVETMMIAGNDTTATVQSFVMLMLANYPEVQERVYQELCEIYGDQVSSDVPVQSEDINRMEYMERVIKETLRLFPVGPFIVRRITEDLDLGEYTLPAGSSAVLGIFTVHRSAKYWPDPLKFDPDRFLPEEVAKRHPFCFMPFSAGPRNCIGVKYAMMAMKVLLATVLRRYILKKDKFLEIKDITVKSDVVLKPVETLTIGIAPRTPKSSGLIKP